VVSTFTTNLNIELPGHNADVGVWDTPTNSNWSLVDNMAGGTLLLNATGLSGTVALTNIQLQPRTIQISGTPTAAITYTSPSGVGGMWVVRNATTGGLTVGFASAAGGSTVTIPASQQLPVWCDGTVTGVRVSNSVYDSSGVHFPDGTTQSTASNSPSLTGVMFPYGGSAAPSWALLCNGLAYSRTTYAALFAIIGTTFGAGDGSTTFNVPDLRGRAPFGNDIMANTAANRITSGVSGINGSATGASGGTQSESAALTGSTAGSLSVAVSGTTDAENQGFVAAAVSGGGAAQYQHTHNFNAAGATSGTLLVTGGTSAVTNMPPTLITNWIIGT
jgi:microcystin-dependent protein